MYPTLTRCHGMWVISCRGQCVFVCLCEYVCDLKGMPPAKESSTFTCITHTWYFLIIFCYNITETTQCLPLRWSHVISLKLDYSMSHSDSEKHYREYQSDSLRLMSGRHCSHNWTVILCLLSLESVWGHQMSWLYVFCQWLNRGIIDSL